MRSVALFLAILILGTSAKSIDITSKNFDQLVLKSEDVWIMEFYAPWCGHCKQLAPTYEQVAGNLEGMVKVGKINCDDEKELAGRYGIKGFPTIKIFPADPKAKSKGPVDYNGARSANAIGNAGLDLIPNHSKTLSAKSFESFSTSPLQKVLLFTEKSSTPPLFKALSNSFKGKLAFGEINKKEADLVKQFDVTTFPQIVVVPASGSPVKYSGGMKFAALQSFLTTYASGAGEAAQGADEAKEAPKPAEPAATPFNVRPTVVEPKEATAANWAAVATKGVMAVVCVGEKGSEATFGFCTKLSSHYRHDPLSFLYADRSQHAAFLKALFGGDPSAMSLAVVKIKRSSISLWSPSASTVPEEDDLRSSKAFLDKVVGGEAKFSAVDIPELSAPSKEL